MQGTVITTQTIIVDGHRISDSVLSSGVKREVHRKRIDNQIGDSVPVPLEFIAFVFQGDEKAAEITPSPRQSS
jgi:hypothetical protein